MTDINWNEIVDLELRGVQRSDTSYRFSPFAAGSLAAMIRRAVNRSEREQPRLAIRSVRLGRLEIGQISELYSRPDFRPTSSTLPEAAAAWIDGADNFSKKGSILQAHRRSSLQHCSGRRWRRGGSACERSASPG